MQGAAATLLVVLAASLVGALALPANVLASSITNRDRADYRVSLVEDSVVTEHILAPSETLSSTCAESCVLHLNRDPGHDGYRIEATDVVSIEDGYLYYDAPPASAAPATGDADQPVAPRTE